jgi:hypothetical protein
MKADPHPRILIGSPAPHAHAIYRGATCLFNFAFELIFKNFLHLPLEEILKM